MKGAMLRRSPASSSTPSVIYVCISQRRSTIMRRKYSLDRDNSLGVWGSGFRVPATTLPLCNSKQRDACR